MFESINMIPTADLIEELKRRGATMIHTGPYQPYDITAKYGAAPIDGPAEVVLVIQFPEPTTRRMIRPTPTGSGNCMTR